jgi:hypothetical protein
VDLRKTDKAGNLSAVCFKEFRSGQQPGILQHSAPASISCAVSNETACGGMRQNTSLSPAESVSESGSSLTTFGRIVVMVTRLLCMVVACVAMVALMDVRFALGDGWNPFAGKDESSKQAVSKGSEQPEPSFFEKMGTGTKNLWYKMTGKTQETERQKNDRCFARTKTPELNNPNQKSSFSFFAPKEQPKKSVTDWMNTTEQVKLND